MQDIEKFHGDDFPWSKDIQETLLNVFHLYSFRGLQKNVINCTLSKQDCLYIAATGSGKSLVFQLTALSSPGVSVVVAPLLSLMEDQVAQLDDLGIPSAVLNASTGKEEFKDIMKDMIHPDSHLKLVYVTPEKLAKSKRVMNQIEKMYNIGRFNRLVIDEVHCCSQWGHDFRKDYKFLSVFKKQFPQTPILGLTATATNEVIKSIQKILNIQGCHVFKSSYYRPTLKYEIKTTPKKDTMQDIAELIKTRFPNQTGIIYCLTIKETEDVAKKLSEEGGVHCMAYHAQLLPAHRTKIQRLWYTNKCRVIAATVAFGLGINKSDVRYVIHYSMSKSLENYYQETGRAGRDGKPAFCVCYYNFADIFRATSLTCAEKTGKRNVYKMLAYCLNKCDCRKQLIANHFEDVLKKDANDTQCCDNCCDDSPRFVIDYKVHIGDLLRILQKAASKREKLTPNKLLDAWTQKGAKDMRVEGLAKPQLERTECEFVLGSLLIDGYLQEDFHSTPYNTISYIYPGPKAISTL